MARKSLAAAFAILALALVAPQAAQAQVYNPNELEELPRIESPRDAMRAIERSYPRALKSAGVAGQVQLAFVVKADGNVDPASVRVVNADNDAFGEAASQAITEIKFKPGKKDGSAVDAQVVIPITYQVS